MINNVLNFTKNEFLRVYFDYTIHSEILAVMGLRLEILAPQLAVVRYY